MKRLKKSSHAVFDVLIKADKGYYKNTFPRWAVPPTSTKFATPQHSSTPTMCQQQHDSFTACPHPHFHYNKLHFPKVS